MRQLLDLVVICQGDEVERLRVDADPEDGRQLRSYLLAAVVRNGDRAEDLGDYVMQVSSLDNRINFTFTAVEEA